MAIETKVALTTEAKRRTGEMWAYGTSFQVKYFVFSAGGHDPTDPTMALAIDPAATTLPGSILFGPEPIDDVVWGSDTCPTFVARLDQGEYSGDMSSLGLVAEIVADPIPRPPSAPPAPLIGYQFLFGVYNRPLMIITDTDGPIEFHLTPFL